MKRPLRSVPRQPKVGDDKIEVEPGADKRLANILKRALNTPPRHMAAKDKKAATKKK